MFGKDEYNTGYTGDDGPESKDILWSDDIGGAVWSSPAIVSGSYGKRIYFGCDDGYLYCYDAKDTDGDYVWRFNAGDKIRSSPCVKDDIVYFGDFIL